MQESINGITYFMWFLKEILGIQGPYMQMGSEYHPSYKTGGSLSASSSAFQVPGIIPSFPGSWKNITLIL